MIGKLLAFGAVIGTLLVGCGGGGGGPAATVGGVYISAGVSPMPAPSTSYSGVVSLNVDNPSGAPISNATVTINNVLLTYNSGLNYYGNTSIAPDGSGNFTLSVTANGTTITATESPFSWTSNLTVQSPFTANQKNAISWSPAAATLTGSSMNYDLRIDDSSNAIVYSTPPTSGTSIMVPPNTLVAGSYSATIDTCQMGPQIANAATGSNFTFSISATPHGFTAQ